MSRRMALERWVIATLAVGWIATAVGVSPPKPQTAPELVAGKQLFAHWCAPCHANEPRLAGTLALQTKYKGQVPAALELRSDLTPELVGFFVRNGVAWMPPFRKTEISDAELAQIGAYLSAPLERRGPPAELLAEEMMQGQEKGTE